MNKDKTERLYYFIGNKIAKLRKEKNITQSNLASTINISRASIVNIEKGRQYAPLHILWAIAESLDISVKELLPSEDDLTVNLKMENLDSHPDIRSNNEAKQILKSFINEIDIQNQDNPS